MSYSKDVRDKLLYTDCKKSCCAAAELLGMSTCDPCIFFSKDENIVSRLTYLQKKAGDTVIEAKNLPECCKRAYIKGVFEIKGTLSAPDSKAPYIEIYFDNENTAESYRTMLMDFSIKSGCSKRRNKYVVYIKNSQGISDFLLLTDASSEALKFMVSKTDREVLNNTNRVTNCDMANIERQNAKYNEEYNHIKFLIDHNLLTKLSERQRDIAMARYNNPFSTYEELGKIVIPGCSKSTISLKMREILKFFG